MKARPISAKMIAMLRWLDAEPSGIASVPYRKGADATAKALADRGLVVTWVRASRNAYQGRHMAITDAGRAALIALIPTDLA